ncbi:hypothetical protein Q7C_1131 [Methylophaga frappieri]|uniref:Uncharacterized protein n=1 Tax=Methylophaga frappieri (strain ATCC BAA-2434 / DSM 25690 / JAM7) TaxID=754477 RepID=I1YH93_METFJ|nr:DUF6746 family protein [Methylophaga frappieri]AFJ02286.1 hypothetical protein Q7C_1131 [Methylophaga frappieri]
MNQFASYTFSAFIALFLTLTAPAALADEQPIQHRQVADITDFDEAKQVFNETTAEIKSINTLNAETMHEIHMITYSLEKAIAYFVENMQGAQQKSAEKMAAVVELVHLGSENNRKVETEIYLEEYFSLAEDFAAKM